MTVQELIIQIYRGYGEDSRYLPYTTLNSGVFDINAAGSVELLRILNEAYRRVCTFKNSRKELVQFPSMKKELNFQSYIETGTCQAGSTASAVVMPSGFDSNDDFYNDYVIEVTSGTGSGQKRYIVDYVGSTQTATVNVDFDTTLDNTSVVKVYKKFMKLLDSADNQASANIALDPIDEIYTVQSIVDLTEETLLEATGNTEHYATTLTDKGDPKEYYFRGDKIIFDTAVDDQRWFKLEYLTLLPEMTAADEEPKIPESYHMALVYWTLHYLYMISGESDYAWARKKDYFDFMNSTQMTRESRQDRTDAQVMLPDNY